MLGRLTRGVWSVILLVVRLFGRVINLLTDPFGSYFGWKRRKAPAEGKSGDPPPDFNVLKYVWTHTPRHLKIRFLISIVFNLFGGLLPTTALVFFGLFLVNVNAGLSDVFVANVRIEQALADFLSFFGIGFTPYTTFYIAIILIALSVLLGYIRRWVLDDYFAHYQVRLSQEIAQTVYNADWRFLSDQSKGRLYTLISEEAGKILGALGTISSFVAVAIESAIYISASAIFVWELTLILAGGQIISVIVDRSFLVWIKRLAVRSLPVRFKLSAYLIDAFDDVKTIKANRLEKVMMTRLFPAMEAVTRLDIKGAYLGLHRSHFVFVWRYVVLAVAVLVTTIIVMVETELLLAFVIAAPQIISRLNSLLSSTVAIGALGPSLQAAHSLSSAATYHAEDFSQLPKVTEFKDTIKFDGVHFGYEKHGVGRDRFSAMVETKKEFNPEMVIHGVDLEVKRGTIVALVGHSGSGKTSLLDLMIGLYRPYQGRILIDGVDYSKLDLGSWREQIAYIAQSSSLFNDTILNNLMLLKPDATEAELDSACKKAQVYDFVKSLPNGYNTLIGERGIKVSGGQAQRLALARGLLKHFDLLVLDESTSNLDVKTEEQFMDVIYGMRGEVTTIMSVHRITAAMRADTIYFLEEGRIKEFGSPYELVQRKKHFYAFWRTFYGDEETQRKIEELQNPK